MARTFFIRIAGDIHGPFDSARVKQLAVAGRIRRQDELSRDRQRWTRARDVKGLIFPAMSGQARSSNGANGTITPGGIHRGNGAADHARPGAASNGQHTLFRPTATGAAGPSGGATVLEVPGTVGSPRRAAAMGINLAGCPDCGEPVSLRAFDCPRCGCPLRRLPLPPQPKPAYRLLRLMASAYAALAIVVALVAVCAAAVLFYCMIHGDLGGAIAAFGSLVACIAAGVTCFALSEALQVFMQIEQNTRATRLAVTHRMLSESGG